MNKTIAISMALFAYLTSTALAEDAKKGEEDFRTYCVSCHGIEGRGDGYVARELKHKPADLTSLSKKAGGKFPHVKVKKIIDGRQMPRAHGTSQMPVWGNWFSMDAHLRGRLQEDRAGLEKEINSRLDNLISYLRTIQR